VAGVADGWGAVVLAGGAARRLGGVDKPLLPVAGAPMLARVLAAVADASPRIVVGPPLLRPTLPPDALLTSEDPPGGGPVAATAAGLALVGPGTPYVALLAADLPFLVPEAVALLRLATMASTVDGAVFVDDAGRRQLLCGVWRVASLRSRLGELPQLAGAPLHSLVQGLAVAEVGWPAVEPRPWYDCDTETDLRRARELG